MVPGYCPGKFSVPGTRVPDFSVPGTVPSVPVLCPHQKLCPDPENPGPGRGIPGTLVPDADLCLARFNEGRAGNYFFTIHFIFSCFNGDGLVFPTSIATLLR